MRVGWRPVERVRARRTFGEPEVPVRNVGRDRMLILACALLGLASTGCDNRLGRVCAAGEQSECTGPDGCAGTRECLPSRTAFGACTCAPFADGGHPPNDSGTSTDPGADASAQPDGGAHPDAGAQPDSSIGQVCAENPCRLTTPQCGCSSAEACYLRDDGSRTCALAGTRGEGDSCERTADCAPGLICPFDPRGCWRACDEDADCVGAGSYCLFDAYDDSGALVDGVRLCSVSCVPTIDGGCPAGWACAVDQDERDRWYSYCRRAGTAGDWQPCTQASDCLPARACAGTSEGLSVCFPYCTVGGSECPSSTRCYPTAATIGGISYGLCGA